MIEDLEISTAKKRKPYNVKTPKRDLDLLYSLVIYRVSTVEQLKNLHTFTNAYLSKKIASLCKKGYIQKGNIHSYRFDQKRQGSYYRITDVGLNVLKKNGYEIEIPNASYLKISYDLLPYKLTFNDMVIALIEKGWRFKDSRTVKRENNINRNSILQGVLISPDNKEHVVYVALVDITPSNLKKMETELLEQAAIIDNYIVFTKGTMAFKKIADWLSKTSIGKALELKMMLLPYGKYYLRNYPDDYRVYSLMQEIMPTSLSFKTNFERTSDKLETLVTHDGVEKYIVNLLDTDLIKIANLQSYVLNDYFIEQRDVLVITTPLLRPLHKKMLKEYSQHIAFLEIDAELLF
ncbi:hypothetical protein ACQKND_16220 [Viridibacillus arvi]|uniref:hypothetical protein n=1 Tax=Viridibacillus arvi TaxID=263475 RepID=UPI003D039C89